MSALKISEAQLQTHVLQMARLGGWLAHHSRPAQEQSGRWSTPMSGDKGLPDLVLVRAPRLIFAELKSEKGVTSPEQKTWLSNLANVPGIEVYVWRPRDLADIQAILLPRPRGSS